MGALWIYNGTNINRLVMNTLWTCHGVVMDLYCDITLLCFVFCMEQLNCRKRVCSRTSWGSNGVGIIWSFSTLGGTHQGVAPSVLAWLLQLSRLSTIRLCIKDRFFFISVSNWVEDGMDLEGEWEGRLHGDRVGWGGKGKKGRRKKTRQAGRSFIKLSRTTPHGATCWRVASRLMARLAKGLSISRDSTMPGQLWRAHASVTGWSRQSTWRDSSSYGVIKRTIS